MGDNEKLDLKGVQKTLLLPLVARAVFSKEKYSPINDYKAIEIVNSLNYDINQLLSTSNYKISILYWIARAYHFDMAIKDFLNKHPNGTVVNLGCGLDTTFNRVDNGLLTWIDIDLPEVIRLREKLILPSVREHYIAKSILDYSWMDEVKKYGDNVFFFAGGLFLYFDEEQVKSIFLNMAFNFPLSKLIFDNISQKGMSYANEMLNQSNMKDALIKWSLSDGKELEKWSSQLKLVKQHSYFVNVKNKFSLPLRLKLLMYFLDLYQKAGIICVEFI